MQKPLLFLRCCRVCVMALIDYLKRVRIYYCGPELTNRTKGRASGSAGTTVWKYVYKRGRPSKSREWNLTTANRAATSFAKNVRCLGCVKLLQRPRRIWSSRPEIETRAGRRLIWPRWKCYRNVVIVHYLNLTGRSVYTANRLSDYRSERITIIVYWSRIGK